MTLPAHRTPTSSNGPAPSSVRHPSGTPGTAALLVLAVGTFALGMDGFVLAGLLPQVSASLHVSPASAGQLTTLFALVYAVGSPVIAAAAGNLDRRVLLGAGMTVFAVGIVLQATGPSFAVVAIGRVLAALGAAGYQATAYGLAGILSDDAHRARSLAVVAGGSSVAIVAGLPFGILVGQSWGWRTAMWVLLGLAVVSLVLLSVVPAAYAPRSGLGERARALTNHHVLAILAGTITVLTPGFLVLAYLPAIMQTAGVRIVIATLGYGAGQVAGTALVPRLIRRRGARAALQLGAIGVTLLAAALTLTRSSPVAGVATMAVLGVCVGLVIVPQQHRLFTLVPTLAPVAIGLNGSAIYLGNALGAAAGGLALSLGSPSTPTITATALAAASVLITRLLPRRK